MKKIFHYLILIVCVSSCQMKLFQFWSSGKGSWYFKIVWWYSLPAFYWKRKCTGEKNGSKCFKSFTNTLIGSDGNLIANSSKQMFFEFALFFWRGTGNRFIQINKQIIFGNWLFSVSSEIFIVPSLKVSWDWMYSRSFFLFCFSASWIGGIAMIHFQTVPRPLLHAAYKTVSQFISVLIQQAATTVS